MASAPLRLAKTSHIQLHWERVYILTLTACFWIAMAEIAYFWL